ncbi:MAG: hypothetical protein P4L50_28610 [Anaerolineaceae bacterium]|nr:hypothetical protein [Anaerolineaceae bacterium]
MPAGIGFLAANLPARRSGGGYPQQSGEAEDTQKQEILTETPLRAPIELA